MIAFGVAVGGVIARIKAQQSLEDRGRIPVRRYAERIAGVLLMQKLGRMQRACDGLPPSSHGRLHPACEARGMRTSSSGTHSPVLGAAE